MQVYDTLSRRLLPLPLSKDERGRPQLKLYVCGVTPYESGHLGHAHTFCAFDILIRHLESGGVHVRYIQNITDVDDPLFERARRDGVDWQDLAEREVQSLVRDMAELGWRPRMPCHGSRRRSTASWPRPRRSPARASPIRPRTAASTSTSHATRALESSRGDRGARCWRSSARRSCSASKDPARNGTGWISRSGVRRRRMSRAGPPSTGTGGRDGTSSARRCRCATWASRWTSTAAAATSSSATTKRSELKASH